MLISVLVAHLRDIERYTGDVDVFVCLEEEEVSPGCYEDANVEIEDVVLRGGTVQICLSEGE